MGILFEKGEVALLRGGAQVLQHTVLELDVPVLDNDLENEVQFGDGLVQKIQILLFDLQNHRRLERVDKQFARSAGVKAADVGDPVALGAEAQVMLCAFVIEPVHAEAALDDERIVPARKTFLEDRLPAFDGALHEPAVEQGLFPFIEGKKAFEVIEEWLEHEAVGFGLVTP